jgi:hypothetical protein
MEVYDAIQIAKAYDKLGWAVADQLDTVLDGTGGPDNLNPNALDLIEEFLDDCARQGLDVDCERGLLEEAREACASDGQEPA